MDSQRKGFVATELVPGQIYRVIASFEDYDRVVHPVGEQWRFVSHSFLPYEDGLTLVVEQDGASEQIRLQWRPETQGKIIDEFSTHVEAI